MKKIASVLLLTLTVLAITLFAACGSDTPATTQPALTSKPDATTQGKAETTTPVATVTTTAKPGATTTTKAPDVTTSKQPSENLVEQNANGVTIKSLDKSLVMNITKNDASVGGISLHTIN